MSDFSDDHDPFTTRYLRALGVSAGWRCADVGAGSGVLARWLREQVGPTGRVVAIDIDGERLRGGLAGFDVEIQVSDIVSDGLSEGEFDLVHSRLTLCNLGGKQQALLELVAAARPGGLIVLGDLDFTTHRPATPQPVWDPVWERFLRALSEAGWPPAFGRTLAPMLEAAGLVGVQAEVVERYVRGGSLPCRLTIRALEQGKTLLTDVDGMEEVAALLADEQQAFFAPAFVQASGRRPTT